MVVVKLMADVCRQGIEPMVLQRRPDAFGNSVGTKIIKLRTDQTEVAQRAAQLSHVEGRVVRNHEIGASQSLHNFRHNGWELRGVQNIEMRQAVTRGEVFTKPAVPFRWSHQPIRSFC